MKTKRPRQNIFPSYHTRRAWYNFSNAMIARPMRTLNSIMQIKGCNGRGVPLTVDIVLKMTRFHG